MSDEKIKDKGDQAERLPEVKPAPEVQRSAVIDEGGNQARWERAQAVHYLGQDESATGLFKKPGDASESTCKFGIDGLDKAPKQNADGTPYQVYKQEAGQALQGLDPLSKPMTESAFQSSVKMQIQATQVPEVTQSVTAQGALKYTGTVMEAGAQSVRQIEEHLAKPGALNRDLLDMALAGSKAPGYLSDTERVKKDFQSLLTGAAQKVDEVVQQIDKPMKPEERAKIAGALLPMFFFEGSSEPIDPKVAKTMGIEKMTSEDLKRLAIEKRTTCARESVGEVCKLVYEQPSKLVVERVAEIAELLPENVRGRVTLSVAVVEDAQGGRSVLVGTSEKYGYLRGVEPQAGEIVVLGPKQHAELDLVTYAQERGLKVVDIGATRPICPHCASKIAETGAHISTPLKTGKLL